MLLAAAFSVNAYAGQWNYDEQRGAWNYTADDGSHPVNQWLLIDSDGDGWGEWYYFWADGYNYPDIVTPDGYTLGYSGAWEIDGVMQLEPLAASAASTGASSNIYGLADSAMTAYVGRFVDARGQEVIFYPDGSGGLAAEILTASEDGWNWRYPIPQWDEIGGLVHMDEYWNGNLMEYTIYSVAGDLLNVATYSPEYGHVGSWQDGTYYRQ